MCIEKPHTNQVLWKVSSSKSTHFYNYSHGNHDVTTTEYRAKYEIYPNKICINENPSQCRNCIGGKILSIGRTIAKDKGFRYHN